MVVVAVVEGQQRMGKEKRRNKAFLVVVVVLLLLLLLPLPLHSLLLIAVTFRAVEVVVQW